jgi:hypothetical protein
MRTIKITTTQHYTKTAVVEIPFPDDIHNLDEVADFLYDNEYLYRDKLEKELASIQPEFDAEQSRYDVIEEVKLTRHLWGGTL